MKRIAFYFSFVVLAVVLASCRNDGKSIITPVSSGRPYEVMVVADVLLLRFQAEDHTK